MKLKKREEVLEALELTGGDFRRAAWQLGVHPEALRAFMRRENLQPKRDDWIARTRAELGGGDGRGDDQ